MNISAGMNFTSLAALSDLLLAELSSEKQGKNLEFYTLNPQP